MSKDLQAAYEFNSPEKATDFIGFSRRLTFMISQPHSLGAQSIYDDILWQIDEDEETTRQRAWRRLKLIFRDISSIELEVEINGSLINPSKESPVPFSADSNSRGCATHSYHSNLFRWMCKNTFDSIAPIDSVHESSTLSVDCNPPSHALPIWGTLLEDHNKCFGVINEQKIIISAVLQHVSEFND